MQAGIGHVNGLPLWAVNPLYVTITISVWLSKATGMPNSDGEQKP